MTVARGHHKRRDSRATKPLPVQVKRTQRNSDEDRAERIPRPRRSP